LVSEFFIILKKVFGTEHNYQGKIFDFPLSFLPYPMFTVLLSTCEIALRGVKRRAKERRKMERRRKQPCVR